MLWAGGGAVLSLKVVAGNPEAESGEGKADTAVGSRGFISSESGVETRCLGDVSGCAQPFRRRGRERGGSDSQTRDPAC